MPFSTWQIVIAHCLHGYAGHRLAQLIGDASGNDTPAWQRKVDAIDQLPVVELECTSRLEWPLLAELQ